MEGMFATINDSPAITNDLPASFAVSPGDQTKISALAVSVIDSTAGCLTRRSAEMA